MRRTVCILYFLLLPVTILLAQSSKSENIKNLKISFISERLNLTPEQATKFWPVYNNGQDELEEIRNKFKKKYKARNPGSDAKVAREYVTDNIEVEQAELNSRKKYKNELLKIITPQQLAALYQANRDFKTMLLKQLMENKAKQVRLRDH